MYESAIFSLFILYSHTKLHIFCFGCSVCRTSMQTSIEVLFHQRNLTVLRIKVYFINYQEKFPQVQFVASDPMNLEVLHVCAMPLDNQ